MGKNDAITLESIEKKHVELGKLIEGFKAQAVTQYVFPETEIELKHSESYSGLHIGKDGAPSHHLILLPGEFEGTYADAMKWAAENGGELPTRREQSLLFANLKEEFKPRYHWSNEQHADASDFAWVQCFELGDQHCDGKIFTYVARAVRRLVIQ